MKRVVLSITAVGGFLALAFGSAGGDMNMGGVGGGAGAGNVAACKAYIEAYNSASCFGGGTTDKMSAAEMCPDALDMSPKDMKPYWNCLKDAIACDGAIPAPGSAEKMAACSPM